MKSTSELSLTPSFISLLPLGVLAGMVLIPFVVMIFSGLIRSFYPEWEAILLGLTALMGLLGIRYWRPVHIPRIALLPCFVALYLGAQAGWHPAVFAGHAAMGALYLLWGAMLMCLAYALRERLSTTRFSEVLAWALLAGGLWSGAAEWVNRSLGLTAGLGGIGQANNYGDYVALAGASLIYLWLCRRMTTALFCLLVLGLGAALAATSSRSVWFYLAGLLVLSGFAGRREGLFFQGRSFLLGSIALLASYVVWQVLAHWLGWGLTSSQRLAETVSGVSPRLHIWRLAWQIFLEHPWFGAGWGQFDWEYFLQAQRHPGLVFRVEHAHNLILDSLCELGLPITVLWVIFLMRWLINLLRQPFEAETWWILGVLSVLGIHSMLEYPLWYAHFLGIAMLALGLGETRAYKINLGNAGRWGLGAMLAGGFAIAFNTWYYYRDMEWVSLQGADRAVQTLQNIQRHAPLMAPYAALTEAHFLELNDTDLPEKLRLNDEAMRFYVSRKVVYFQTAYLALAGRQDEALALLDKALVMYPEWSLGYVRSLSAMSAEQKTRVQGLIDHTLRQMPAICIDYYPDEVAKAVECQGSAKVNSETDA